MKNFIFDNFIQIAGVIDLEEANMLVSCGVKFLGFPLRLEVHQPDLSEEEAAEIIKNLPNDIHPILITYLNCAKEIGALCKFLGTSIVQIHGPIEVSELRIIHTQCPDLLTIKSLIVGKENPDQLIQNVAKFSQFVDAFITDTYDPHTGATGATGIKHDWAISRKIIEVSNKPVILAGGLNHKNVKSAIEKLRPAGVDAHTGVEGEDGRKDMELVKKFVREARAGFGISKKANCIW